MSDATVQFVELVRQAHANILDTGGLLPNERWPTARPAAKNARIPFPISIRSGRCLPAGAETHPFIA